MNERRKGEGRKWGPPPEYPFIDSNGVLVTKNRRRVVDRRTSARPIGADTPATPIARRLLLSFLDNTLELTETQSELLAGRSPDCDIRITNNLTSRVHARFLFRGGHFYITDQSTNGTYLKLNQQDKEIHLLSNEIQLSGIGLISLGCPIEDNENYTIRFACE